jgi:hypothetical protein
MWVLVMGGVGVILLVAAWELRGAAQAGGTAGRTASRMAAAFGAGYAGWIAVTVTVTVTVALAGADVYKLENDANKPWLGLGFAVPAIGLLLLTRRPAIRRALSGPGILSRLTRPHQVRVMGVIWLLALALGELPAAFALPAGIGDIAIGLAAPWVARGLRDGNGTRRAFWFNVAGIADFVVAFAIGFLAVRAACHLAGEAPGPGRGTRGTASAAARIRGGRHRIGA